MPTNCKTKLVDHDDEFVAKIKCAELIYDQDNEQLLPYIRLEVDSYQDDDGQYEFIVDPGDIEVVEVLRPKQETIENLASRALFAMQYVYGYEDKDENADRKVIASQVRDEIDSSYEQRERVLAYSRAREIYKSLAKSYEFIAEEGELSEKVHNLQDEIIGLSQELSAIANTHPEVLWIQMDGVAAFKLSGAPGGSTASMEKKATEYDYDLRQTSSFKEHVYARVRGEFSPRQQPVLTRLEDDRYKMHLVSYVYDPSDTHMTESPMADSVVNYKTCITQLENAEIKFMHEVDEERYSEVALALEDVPSSSVAPLAYLVQQVREEEALTPGDRTRLLDLNRGELIYDVSKLDHKPKVAAVLDLLLKDRHMYIDVGYNNSEALKIYGVDVDQNEMHIRAIDTSTDELVTVPLLYLVGSKITKIS